MTDRGQPQRQDSLTNPATISPLLASLPGLPRPQMPPDGRSYFDTQAPRPSSAARKRSRTASVALEDGRQPTPPKKGSKVKDEGEEPPSVLVREKKQKACANCRRAKLKCIVEGNETECVRCRARKERCVFYPRGHDEDWQQTLTGDLYNAIGHLSQLSAAVHHILHHLTVQGMVPPLESPLPTYEMPDRDMSVLQGWGAERNRELGSSGKRRRKKDEEDDDDEEGQMPVTSFTADYQIAPNNNGMVVSSSGLRPSDMHMPPPPNFASNSHVQQLPATLQTPLLGSAPSSTVSLPFHDSNGGTMSTPTRPTPDGASISPVDSAGFGITPGQMSQPSSGIPTAAPIGMGTPYPVQGGIFGLLNGSKPSGLPASASVPTQAYENDQFGSSDPRPNIVKRGVISNNDALTLVDFFHTKLARWLFGYRLEFGKFPYIPQGPSVMTPFILSVLCFISSERVPSLHGHQAVLGNEVNQLLLNSPADSFISTLESPFNGGTGLKDEDGEEELDPELGIGPEEIVGACVLATFTTDRESASTIAASAFKWARGWIKWTSLTVPLPPTLGEVCGLLPIKRDATREDMARVWLLCYIVDGTEALQRDNPPPPRRDPMAYCHVLVPDNPLPGDPYSPYDILLTFHARLITLLRDWYHRRPGGDVGAGVSARLASSINGQLEWWRADLESHNLAEDWMRHINLFWEFARMLVNATSAKSLSSNPRLSAASWAIGVEAAVGFLEKSCKWPQRNELANLPPCYLNMTSLAGSVLVDAIKESSGAECPVQPDEACPLLNTVSDMLAQGDLPSSHPARQHAKQLREYASQLSAMAQ